jgi:hypothetical protein
MRNRDLKLNTRKYKRPNFAVDEFLIIQYIGAEWIVAKNETGKEVIFEKPTNFDNEWEYFDSEIIDPDDEPNQV